MWNHPGFGGSTGLPYPEEEAAAIDVVVQFALTHLGWDEGDLVLYGWSIGGYTSTWATMNYPNIRGLVLDATFDDIIPLAVHTMPQSWSPLVVRTIRTYFNLHIEKQLSHYNGPVTIVRRLKDEVMAAAEGIHDPLTMRRLNRANHLFKHMLKERYPNIFRAEVEQAVDDWLAATVPERSTIFAEYMVDEAACRAALFDYITHTQPEATFPLMFESDSDLSRRQMALFLCSKHLLEFDATHCVPLPASTFAVPDHPWI